MSKKYFKFSVRTQSGKLIAQEIVTFGSKKHPFPKDWKNSGMAIKAIFDYEREFQNKFAPVTYEEGSKLDPYPEYESIETAAQKKYDDGSNIVMDVDISDSLQSAFIDGAMSDEAKTYWYNLFLKDHKPCEDNYNVEMLDKIIESGNTKLLERLGLSKSLLEWEDVTDTLIRGLLIKTAKKLEPVATASSLHMYEEQYNINNQTYKFIYEIGNDKVLQVKIKNKKDEI